MKSEKMFEMAVRNKYRYAYKGSITTEDLFDLPVESLDLIFKDLNSRLKQSNEESLLSVKTPKDEEIEIKIEIIKYIVGVKLDEKAARLQAKEKKEKKQKILEILASKQDEALQNKTPEELQAMLAELDN